MSKIASVIRFVVELIVFLAVVAVLSFGIRTFVINPYVIPSSSMESTLNVGDMIFSEKVTYETGGSPQPGDIVTFYNTIGDLDENGNPNVYVKRCIAVAGQTVTIKQGEVYVDGKAFDDSFVNKDEDGKTEPTYGGTFLGDTECADDGLAQIGGHSVNCDGSDATCYSYTLKEGEIWCMGDNRTNSYDSRYFGPVPVENVTGHVVLRYWPLNAIGTL